MSRSTIINEISNRVSGTFLLHDLLSISTMSGSINITVVPQPSKTPAELRVHSISGSINVTMAPFLHDASAQIPERIFKSSIQTTSGSITAALIHNHHTSLSTTSGSIQTSLYPVLQHSTMSNVDVRSVSGSTSFILHPFVNDPGTSLKTLSADFRGVSGNLKIYFPSTWEGEIDSLLKSGRVRHMWEGLQVLKDGSNFRATTGNGSGHLNIQGTSMSVELVGEKVPGLPIADLSGDRVPVVPGMSGSRTEAKERHGDLNPNLEDEKRLKQAPEDDDDWTIVGDEDGVEKLERRPPPSYEDATRR